jgi:uncharacterized protein YdaU (DUF1376 family)
MHYFKRNIGDYHRKAGRLTMLEHGAYTLLMDACYDRELFPTRQQAIDWCFARTEDEIKAVEFVLGKFFELSDDGTYVQLRILQELLEYQKNCETNKQIAIEREEKKRLKKKGGANELSTNRALDVYEQAPNQEPLTINQEQDIKPTSKSLISPCPVEQIISLYQEHCTRLPRLRVIPDKTKSAISARWRQDSKFQSFDFWKGFFDYCNDNKFLSGQSNPRPGADKPFRADLNWLVKPEPFANIINEKYA